jgi:hypothetical protein
VENDDIKTYSLTREEECIIMNKLQDLITDIQAAKKEGDIFKVDRLSNLALSEIKRTLRRLKQPHIATVLEGWRF